MADWSDADIRTVKSMWKRGATAAEIATALGPEVTRGAVLGKIHRLALKRAEDTGAKAAGAKAARAKAAGAGAKALGVKARARSAAQAGPAPAMNGAKPRFKAAPGSRAPEPSRREPEPIGPRPIWALGQCQCRWPIGNLLDPPGLFCGAATADGSSWCPVHAALVYNGSARPRPAAVAVPAPRLAVGGRSRF